MAAAAVLTGTTPAAAEAAPAVPAAPAATPTYAVRVLPVAYADAITMSGTGLIAGTVGTSEIGDPNAGKPFVWSAKDGLTILPVPADNPAFLTVLGINDNGWVVGSGQSTTTGAYRGFIWRPAGGAYELIEMGHAPGSQDDQPVGIDNQNRVVGSSREYPGALFSTPFLWTEAAGMQRMVDLGYVDDPPHALSSNGWVATANYAYRLGAPLDVQPLPALPAPYTGAWALDIANDGDRFVQLSHFSGGTVRIRLFRLDYSTGTWTPLWPTDLSSSVPSGLGGVNARGDAVGWRMFSADVSWAPGLPVTPLDSYLAGGYAGVPTDPYPGVQITSGRDISTKREVAGTALFGNNGGRLVRLVPVTECTASTCLRVDDLAISARNPQTCTPGATIKVTATVTVRDQSDAAVAGAQVRVQLLSEHSIKARAGLTDANGVVRLQARLGACEGTVTALVDSVTKQDAGFDQTRGVLVRNVVPRS